jgi:hypothetical protein
LRRMPRGTPAEVARKQLIYRGAVERRARKVHKYEKAIEEDRIPTYVEIGRELEDTARELRESGFPEQTVGFATLRKLKLRKLGYVHTAVIYGNAFHDGKQHRKRIEVVSKYPLRHLHHAFLHETFTPPWAVQDKNRQITYHKKYRRVGMPIPEYRGMPSWNYNVFTWAQVRDGRYAVSKDTVMAQWTEYEQVS